MTGNLTGNASTATTALSCSGNSATATLANEAKNLQNTTPETKDESFFSKVVTEDADMVSFQTLKGNSVVWNQIIAKPYIFGETRDYTFLSWFNGGSRSINNKGQFIFITNGGETGVGNALSITPKNTHKYLLSYKVKADIASVCTIYKTKNLGVITNIAEADKWYFVSFIGNNVDTGSYSSYLNAVVAANSPETTVTIDDAQVIDLTQMFGAGNEPSTYEEYLSRKPKVADEFAYNEGEIINNKVEKVVTTGRNLWDEEWELGGYNYLNGKKKPESDKYRSRNFIPVLSGKDYFWAQQNKTYKRINFYDANRNFISYTNAFTNQVFTTPINCAYITIWQDGTTYNHDLCINISDPTINGQYFPYEKHELDLSWVKDIKDAEGVKLFEDGMRSAGTAFDEAAKGRAIKRIGSVDLGTLNWTKSLSVFYASVKNIATLSGPKDVLCTKYASMGDTVWDDKRIDKSISHTPNDNLISIRDDAYADAASFKAAMSGVMLYYELAEPIEVELPYGINHTLPVWKDGMMYA